ncbi:MAG: hypothetical protein LBP20_03915 [Treponema sp.]|jgi:hypothetical protein|nr:hypothetical protein [Treponema sp.]
MKTTLYAAIAIALLSTACTTIDMSTYEDEYIYAELESNNPKQVTLTVDNLSAGELTLEQTGASCRYNAREFPLVPVTQSAASAAPLSPGARHSWNFAAQQPLNLSGGTQGGWVPENSSAMEFRFAYRLGGEERSITFPDSGERTLIGTVQAAVDIPLPFLKSVTERRRKVFEQALAQAKTSFGADGKKLRLVNLRYYSTSNGFVENAVLSADVIAAGSAQ